MAKISVFLCWVLFIFLASDQLIITKGGEVGGGGRQRSMPSSPVSSCILVFGDSTVDPGNNNYLDIPFRANFLPYGKDFVNHTPTGRWSNGRLAIDFIANYLGIKEFVPPYLDPTLSIRELITGVSFASAGSGFDPLTPAISKTIPTSKQLEHFKEYQAKVEVAIGREKMKELISNALFIISAGTNDFLVNYFMTPTRRQNYNISSYSNLVGQLARKFFQELHEQGGRRIGVVGLPPMGCLPFVMTFYSKELFVKRECNDTISSLARQFNQNLHKELDIMQAQLQPSGSRFAYIDLYGPLEEMILHRKYGFEEVKLGCCGTGLVEFSFLCNRLSHVCADAAKYVFWDSFHPTEATSHLVYQHNRPVIHYLAR